VGAADMEAEMTTIEKPAGLADATLAAYVVGVARRRSS
jgi:hypothetical protein